MSAGWLNRRPGLRRLAAAAARIVIVCTVTATSSFAASEDGGTSLARNLKPVDEKILLEIKRIRTELAEQFSPKRSFALVVGIDSFNDPVWPRLPGVLEEIEEVATGLAAHGFRVLTPNLNRRAAAPSEEPGQNGLKPLTSDELDQLIKDFIERYGRDPANRLIIYVASHGHADQDAAGNPEENGIGYIVTYDSPSPKKSDFRRHAYSVTKLAHSLLNLQAQHVFIFFNACFSGAMVPQIQTRATTESGVVRELSDEIADWAMTLLGHNARLILTAGSDRQTVPDVNNPFSKAVVEGLAGAADQDGDGLILGTELAHYVRARVAEETRRKERPNDPVFAFIPKTIPPASARSDLKFKPSLAKRIDYRQNGDFIFLSPRGPWRKTPGARSDAAAPQQPWLPQTQFKDCPDCPIMVEISSREGHAAFALAQTETTFLQWDACYRDFYCQTWIDDRGLGRGNRPVSGITWLDALQFIAWMDAKRGDSSCEKYRLPTPLEWSYAARGNTSTRYPWGDEIERDQANCWNCGSRWDGVGPTPVGRFKPNAFELYDMVGNLWEWVEAPDNRCTANDMLNNGRCPADGSVMGGAFSTRAEDLSLEQTGQIPRTANDKRTSYRLASVGLRLACTLGGAGASAASRPNQ